MHFTSLKRTRAKTVRLFAAMLALVMLLTACGGGGGGGGGGAGGGVRIDDSIIANYAFLAEQVDLTGIENHIQGSMVQGDRIYFHYIRHDFNPPEGEDVDRETWEPDPPTLVIASVRFDGSDQRETNIQLENRNASIAGFHITAEGNFGLLITEWEWDMTRGSGRTALFYAAYDQDGRELTFQELTGVVPEVSDWFSVSEVFFADDGSMVITAWGDRGMVLHLLDGERRAAGELEMDWGRGITQLRDGRVVVATEEMDGQTWRNILRVVDFEAGDWGETLPMSVGGVREMFPARSGDAFDLIMDDGNHLFGYTIETGERTLILNWIESGLAAQWDYYVGFLADGRISVLVSSWNHRDDSTRTELMTLSRVSRADLPERVIITLGGMWLPNNVREEIVAFNRNNLTHQIQVRDFGMYNTPNDWNAGSMRMMAELAAGIGPDIIWGGMVDAFADRGLFADLYQFIDADPTLSRADFFPNILRAMEAPDGTLPTIASSFGLQTMIGSAAHVGHITSWTLNDMLQLIEETDPARMDTVLGDWMTGESFLNMVLWFSSGDLIDWDARQANLNSEAFIDLLHIAARLPDAHNWEERQMGGGTVIVSGHMQESEWARMRRGDQLLMMTGIWDPGRYQEFRAALDDLVVLGLPTQDGGAHVINPGEGFGINAASPRQNEAWDFVRQFLLPSAEMPWNFSIRIDLYEAQIAEAMTPRTWDHRWGPLPDHMEEGEEMPQRSVWISGDHSIDVYSMTAEEAAGLREIVESASVIGRFHQGVWGIIQEELLPFFAGDRTADNTARIIQNRVQTFLNEQR